jgi:hypothetical protein
MPEAMVTDERSVIFMISGSMTQNKNAQVLLQRSSSSPRFCVIHPTVRYFQVLALIGDECFLPFNMLV